MKVEISETRLIVADLDGKEIEIRHDKPNKIVIFARATTQRKEVKVKVVEQSPYQNWVLLEVIRGYETQIHNGSGY